MHNAAGHPRRDRFRFHRTEHSNESSSRSRQGLVLVGSVGLGAATLCGIGRRGTRVARRRGPHASEYNTVQRSASRKRRSTILPWHARAIALRIQYSVPSCTVYRQSSSSRGTDGGHCGKACQSRAAESSLRVGLGKDQTLRLWNPIIRHPRALTVGER